MLESVDPAVVGLSKDRLTQITRWLDAQVADGKLAGASTLIARRGKGCLLRSAGLPIKKAARLWMRTPLCASTP